MTRTSYLPEGAARPGLERAPLRRHAGRASRATDTGAMAPAGQVWSTLADLGALRRASCSTGTRDVLARDDCSTRRSRPQSGDRERRPGATRTGSASSWSAAAPGMLVGHTGSMPGFLAGCFVDRARRTGGGGARQRHDRAAPRGPGGRPARRARGAASRPSPPPWRPTPRRARPELADVLGRLALGQHALRVRDAAGTSWSPPGRGRCSTPSPSSTAACSGSRATTPARSCTSYAATTARSATSTWRRSSTPGRPTTRTRRSPGGIRPERPRRRTCRRASRIWGTGQRETRRAPHLCCTP